jgi:hypothetical protein
MSDNGALMREIAGAQLALRPSGALHWPERALLAVADLHLGRSERMAREGGGLLPPYETRATLDRLEAEVAALAPRIVLCLGDSFDDLEAAAALSETVRARLDRLAAGRRWIWLAGNHDPGPVELPGSHLAEARLGPLVFRHVAEPAGLPPEAGEISGHYHPKACIAARGRRFRRACFLLDAQRLILPAFGTYTGGLDARHPAFDAVLGPGAVACLIGGARVLPVARGRLA